MQAGFGAAGAVVHEDLVHVGLFLAEALLDQGQALFLGLVGVRAHVFAELLHEADEILAVQLVAFRLIVGIETVQLGFEDLVHIVHGVHVDGFADFLFAGLTFLGRVLRHGFGGVQGLFEVVGIIFRPETDNGHVDDLGPLDLLGPAELLPEFGVLLGRDTATPYRSDVQAVRQTVETDGHGVLGAPLCEVHIGDFVRSGLPLTQVLVVGVGIVVRLLDSKGFYLRVAGSHQDCGGQSGKNIFDCFHFTNLFYLLTSHHRRVPAESLPPRRVTAACVFFELLSYSVEGNLRREIISPSATSVWFA